MAGYTKADFFSLYSDSPVCPETYRRYVEIRLHYHPLLVDRIVRDVYADRLAAKLSLTADDKVLLPGCGFGWLGEKLVASTGCEVLGVEVSDYVFEAKDRNGDEELLAAIQGSRRCDYTEEEGIGKEIWDKFSDGRKFSTVPIIYGNYCEGTVDLGEFVPTVVVTEELLNAFRNGHEEHRLCLVDQLDALGVPVYHIIDGAII